MNGNSECVQNTRRDIPPDFHIFQLNGGGPHRQNGQWEDIIEETTAKDSARAWFVRLGSWRYWRRSTIDSVEVMARTWLASSKELCSRVETRSFLLAVISTYPHATPLNLAAISKIWTTWVHTVLMWPFFWKNRLKKDEINSKNMAHAGAKKQKAKKKSKIYT